MNVPFAVCTVCYCGLIFYVSSLSNPPVPDLGLFSWDKLLHAGAYAVLGWLAAMTLRRSRRSYLPATLFIVPAVFAALYGLSDELHTPHHEFHFKLKQIKGRLYTDSGRRMAEERHRFMEAFFERMAAEVRGEH